MTKALLDADGGVIKTFHDIGDDKSVIESVQDIEPLLDENKILQNESTGYTPSRDLRRVASIPLVVVQQWSREAGINLLALPKKEFADFVFKKLRDPDNRFFRTTRGGL